MKRCIRVMKGQTKGRLLPTYGSHNGFKAVAPRQAGNEFDTWNSLPACLGATAFKLEKITDDVIDGHLGKQRSCHPSIRQRISNLLRSGHYDLTSIKCRNVLSKNDCEDCILICCDCLSSKSSSINTVYALFEDKVAGKYKMDESSCSCKKGEYFCSHSIGFLYMIGLFQKFTFASVKQFYQPSPKLIQSNLMLIENALIGDKFKQQNAQRKRQRITK